MIINSLIFLIALVCLSPKANTALKIFVVPALLFQVAVLFGVVPRNSIFFLSAAALDLAVIAILVNRSAADLMAVAIGLVSLLSIAFNMLGWSAYENYQDPAMYDGMFVSLYALVLALTLTDWWTYARDDSNGSRVRGYSH
jgi:hypothetical protein